MQIKQRKYKNDSISEEIWSEKKRTDDDNERERTKRQPSQIKTKRLKFI